MGSNKKRLMAASVALLTAVGLGMIPAHAQVDPPSVDVTLGPGDSHTVTKSVQVPAVPPKLDLLLDVDLSSSYSDDLPVIKSLKSGIFNGVRAIVPDSSFGLASFVDYPFAPWGFGSDYAYRLDQDLTMDQATWEAAVDAMMTLSGGDEPESQLESLFQAATGAGREIPPPDGDFADPGEIPPGLQASFRADATKVIAITTDASMHEAADSSCTSPSPPCPFPYPGPSFADTVAALNAAGIKVVAIKAGPGVLPQMDDLANQTGGVVTSTSATSEEIVAAITGAIEELTFDVTATPVGCAPLDITFVPPVHEDVAGGATVSFQETIAVPAGTAAGEVTCTVEFKANDTVIGTQEVHVAIVSPEQCAGEAATMVGTGGDDTIIGTLGRDVVQAFGGEDEVIGLRGDDVICGDSGDDDLSGGGGDDLLFGNGGVDELSGGRGVDQVVGGPGVDEISGDSGDDSVIGEAGFDELSGGSGDDRLNGWGGNDELSAGSGDDRLAGGRGEDELSAGSGDDRLAGGDGDDGLSGGSGIDDCDGGAGTDTEANCETVVNVP